MPFACVPDMLIITLIRVIIFRLWNPLGPFEKDKYVILTCLLKEILETLASGIMQPMLLDPGGARVGVLSGLFEDRE